jgi:hypothetical protein
VFMARVHDLPEELRRFGNSRNVEMTFTQASPPFSSPRLNFQSFFAVGSLDTFSATPAVNGLSPILKAVPDCAISQDETFPYDIASFVAASAVSALDALIRYLTLLPSFSVSERTVSFPSSVCSV